jgi:hypothetical protein
VADTGFLDELEGFIPTSNPFEMLDRTLDAWITAVQLAALSSRPSAEWMGAGRDRAFGDADGSCTPVPELSPDQLDAIGAAFAALRSTPYATAPELFIRPSEDVPTGRPVPLRLHEDWKAFVGGSARAQLLIANRQLVKAAINLRRFGSNHGSYPDSRVHIPELANPDAFTARMLVYEVHYDGSASVVLDGVDELAGKITVGSSARVRSITLPPPR